MKLIIPILMYLLPFSIFAGLENREERTTALYFISIEGDYIGQGTSQRYVESEKGHFTVNTTSPNALQITYQEDQENGIIYAPQHWSLEFIAPRCEKLRVGKYRHAQRASSKDHDRPGFSFSGNERSCTKLRAEFEILEIAYDKEGKLVSFAADFKQWCEKSKSPLIGAVRVNSTIPLKWQFDAAEDLETHWPDIKESVLYLVKYNLNNFFVQPQVISNYTPREMTVKLIPCKYHGVEIDLTPLKDNLHKLNFIAPFSDKLNLETYDHALRYPYNGYENPGIEILGADGSQVAKEGAFKVLAYDVSNEGWIRNLAIDFKVQTPQGEILEGAVRYHSTYPIVLKYPYTHEFNPYKYGL